MKSMALAPLLLLTLILSAAAVLEAAVDADPPTGAAPPTGAVSTFCEPRCAVRCSKAGRPNRCLTYCNICCAKCHCVPSGTYGNKDECPCYRDLKNSKGGPKCP